MIEGVLTWAEVDLDAVEFNIRAIQRAIGPAGDIFAVVKANAYGHGAAAVAQAALQAGAKRLAVHRAIEGLDLREAGLQAPILVLGYTPLDGARRVVEARLTPSVVTLDFARALSGLAQELGFPVPVHIKVDTGMNRHGLAPEAMRSFANELRHLPGIFIEGIFTQFSTADWTDRRFALEQLHAFNCVLADLHRDGIAIPLVHAANSAAIFNLPEAHFGGVRPGLAMYGIAPSTQWPLPVELHPALSLKSRVVRVHNISPGGSISYNRSYIADRPLRAALVPVGYGDGFPRSLSDRGWVLIRGQRARILGLVCMDQVIVDVSSIPGVRVDDEVVIIGRQGNEQISVQELADLAGTVPNEILASLSARVVRTYIRKGQQLPQGSELSRPEMIQYG